MFHLLQNVSFVKNNNKIPPLKTKIKNKQKHIKLNTYN